MSKMTIMGCFGRMNTQGLGYRNLFYLLVMINSLKVHTDSAGFIDIPVA